MKDQESYDRERCGKERKRKQCNGIVFMRPSVAVNYKVGVCAQCGAKKIKVINEIKTVR